MSENIGDKVYTPVHIAQAIINDIEFKIVGKVLDPFRGKGAFYDNYPEGVEKDWCEIDDGKDFFDYNEKVDWIVSNPPYSIFSKVLEHSLEICDNIVYLIPINKLTSSFTRIKRLMAWGGIPHVILMSPKEIGFPFGFAVGAVYFKKGYTGPTTFSTLESRKLGN